MRFVLGVVLAALALSAPAFAAKNRPAAPRLHSAGGELKSWGVTLHRWTMNADGRIEHISGERVGGDRTNVTIETRRFTLSAKQRRAFEAAVDKVERVLARPPGCENQMTDAPYGSLRWVKGKEKIDVPFSGNCVKGRDFDLAVAIFAADAMIDKAAVALRPVERHRLVR